MSQRINNDQLCDSRPLPSFDPMPGRYVFWAANEWRISDLEKPSYVQTHSWHENKRMVNLHRNMEQIEMNLAFSK